jgi:hypothetical protein
VSSPTATLAWPGHSATALNQTGNVFQGGQSFGSTAAMDTAFPKGSYDYSLSSASLSPTTQTGTLTLPSSFYALSVPFFTNYTSLQNLNPANVATFNWNSFATNSLAQFSQIFLVIRDTTANSTIVNEFFSDSATSSYNLTSGATVAGHNYVATLYFSSRNSSAAAWSAGANGLVAFDLATNMSFTASAIPEPAATAAILAGMSAVAWGISRRRSVGRRSDKR